MILICSVQNEFLLIKGMEERQFYTALQVIRSDPIL